MTAKCIHHPGRTAVLTVEGKGYCESCQAGIVAARRLVGVHVEPKECFVWYVGANQWRPISGTGCAHWVAHQRNIRVGTGSERCLAGFTYRVKTLIQGCSNVLLANVQMNDIYVTPAEDHTGLVIRVVPNPTPGGPPVITIRHDSSRQGRVAENDFASYFKGIGTFYR